MSTPDIQTLYDEAAWRAERIVSWMRLAVAVSIAIVFYFAASRQAPINDIVLVRQLVVATATIAGYAILGVVALWVVASRNFRPWMAWLFSTIDVLLMLASLDAVLVNYDMAGYFLPTAPVLWIAPVILAFGVLRYNPLLQVYMAVLALGGVIAVVAVHMPTLGMSAGEALPDHVLRLFAAPPNVIRLAMLALFCVVLVAAAVRARMLLRRAIAEGTRRANLTRYLPNQIVEGLSTISTEALMRGRKQTGAVMFVDIRGFTARAETLDPAELGRFLSDFRRIVREAIERHGGVVDKHIGDAVMVIFGLPRASGGDARNALAAAREVVAGIARWNEARAREGDDAVAIGIGVHWGEMFVGGIGDEERLEVTVLGDTVNIAARLQELSKHSGHVLVVSRDLLDAANEDPSTAGWDALPPQVLRGRHHPTDMFGLNGSLSGERHKQ
jgi:adenylate cyclase